MANLTFTQVEDYCRAYVDELDSQKFTQNEVLIWGTLAQRKVQQDLMSLGVKSFTKRVYNSGNPVNMPSDILDIPKALILAKCTAGSVDLSAKATVTSAFTGANNDIVITAREPGTWANGGVFQMMDIADPGAYPLGTVRFEGITPTDFDIWVNGGVTTATQLIGYLEANATFNELFTVALKSGDTGAGTVDSVSLLTLAGGSGNRWVIAREVSVEEWHTLATTSANSYKAPTATSPIYCIQGETAGTKQVSFLPMSPPASSIYHSMFVYKYRCADLTTTGSLTIPQEYEELVLTDIMTKMFDKLSRQDKKEEQRAKYADILDKYKQAYVEGRQSEIQEKTRLQTTGTNS